MPRYLLTYHGGHVGRDMIGALARKQIGIGVVTALTVSAMPVHAQARDTNPRTPTAPSPPGRLIDIGGYRLHLNCSGSGSPTVVLSSGAGDYSVDWGLVQPDLARFTRVCSYDRADEAW